MSQTNTNIVFAGLDIAKSSLQLHLADPFHALTQRCQRLAPAGQTPGHSSNRADHLRSHWRLRTAGPAGVAGGGHCRQPRRSRTGAPLRQSQGLRAKSDPIDAAVLTAYGRAFQPPLTPATHPTQRQLSQLTSRRRQLVDLKIIEHNRAEHYADAFSQKQSRQLTALLEKQIAQCDEQITRLIEGNATLKNKFQRLDAIPGVGPATAAAVLAEMPELGHLSAAAAAALAGVAPYNDDSGNQASPRHIAGGRKARVRCALYMAALSAVRYDRILKDFYLRLRAAGKKPKVALTACMRKLIVLMNHLLKNPDFQLAT